MKNRFLMRDLGVVLWISNQHSPLADLDYPLALLPIEIGDR
jgi:hypothetical protein